MVNYDRESSAKTLVGACLSITVAVLFCLGFFYFSKEIVYKENPTTRVTKEISESSFILIENYPFVLYPMINRSPNISTFFKFFSIEAYQVNGSIQANKSSLYKLIVSPCESVWLGDQAKRIKNIELNSILCINPYKVIDPQKGMIDYKPRFGTTPEDEQINKVVIDVVIKKGQNKKITESFNSVDVSLISLTSFVNVSNYEQPVLQELESTLININSSLRKSTEFFFSTDKLTSDNGWMLPNIQTQEFIGKAGSSDFYGLVTDDNPRLATVFFTMKKIKEVYHREYVKLQTVLAQIGGIAKAFVMFGQVMVDQYASYVFFVKIANVKLKKRRVVTRDESGINIKREENDSSVNLGFFKYLFTTDETLSKEYGQVNLIKDMFDIRRINEELEIYREKKIIENSNLEVEQTIRFQR